MSRRYEDNSYGSSENTRLVGGMGSDEGTDESSPLNSYNHAPSSAHSGISSSSGFRKNAGMNGLTLTGAMDPRGRTTQQALEVPKGASSPYALPSQPNPTWMQGSEMDDWLHDPKDADKHGSAFSNGFPIRGFLNIGLLACIALALTALFAGYPIIDAVSRKDGDTKGGSNLGGTNSSGQIAALPDLPNLIDAETPDDAQSRTGFDGKKYKLVFSDEFNVDGRSFYPGDDPYWEAVDLWYWGTQNYEWYDPAAITTSGGALQITLSESPEHNKNFRGGMVQSWNKFCFSGGYLEASIRLPGYSDVSGLWPAFWMMGNLGRAGYGASLEGTWPYSYESCDVGTIWNQTNTDGTPTSNAKGGFTAFNGQYHTSSLSWLQGQRLSACTCDGEDHPGPKVNGKFKGRAAPEIDVFEGQVGTSYADGKSKLIQLSQSLQSAPFNNLYTFSNTSGPAIDVFDPSHSQVNTYKGAAFQQATSVVTDGIAEATEFGSRTGDVQGGSFGTYGVEFEGGVGGTATWVSNGQKSWALTDQALVADPVSQIGPRVMAAEPMYIIFNLGISQSFGTPDFAHLKFPSTMSVDWVRVYQPEDNINIGCDPSDYPTQDYINRHPDAYNNAQLQFWGGTPETGGYGQVWPKNSYLKNGCSAENSHSGVENPADPKKLAPYVSQDSLPPY